LIEYIIKTDNPEIHIQVCEIISIMGINIIEDKFGEIEDGFYGYFRLKGDEDSFEILSEFPNIILEIPRDKILR
jgi:hypothetical protein